MDNPYSIELTIPFVSLLVGTLLIGTFGIVLEYRYYLKEGYLRPSLYATAGILFYGLLPALYLATGDPLHAFVRYNTTVVVSVQLMYLAALLGSICATLATRTSPIPPFMGYTGSINHPAVASAIASLIAIIGFEMMFRPVGGIVGFLFSARSRLEIANEVFGQGVWSLLNYYVFNIIASSLLALGLFLEYKKDRRISPLTLFAAMPSVFFVGFNLIGGTRLILFNTILIFTAAFFLIFRKRLKPWHIAAVLCLFVSMNFVGNKRQEIRGLLGGEADAIKGLTTNVVGMSITPAESFTGYIPAFIVSESNEAFFDEPQYIKLIPTTVARMFGIDKMGSFSTLLAEFGGHINRSIVFTVPLPIDAYYGLRGSYFAIFLYSFFFFFVLNFIGKFAVRRGNLLGLIVYLVLIGTTWTVIRYDLNRSFSRLWQAAIFVVPFLTYLFLVRQRIRLAPGPTPRHIPENGNHQRHTARSQSTAHN